MDHVSFRIVMTGSVDPAFLGTVLDGIKRIVPIGGGFTIDVGTHAQSTEQESL